MGDDSLILREDGYIRMNFPVTSLTYHSNLNIILVKTDVGGVHVLDVNSGVILQSSCLSADDGGTLGVEYAPGADRVFVWDSSGVGARTDYNGVLLLHTALQRPLPSSQPDKIIRIELVLSEAVLLYQCLQSLDVLSIEGLADFINELKNSIDAEPVRKGVKAQKWSTVTISLPQSTVRLVTTGVVQELKTQNRRIPALAIASAVGQRANELVPCSRDEEVRPVMYSEAERKETFKRWPHMDYKWALPARMAQAGFYHQPSPSGDDRAMCFTCMVCLVCWEKSDEPWVEHERHSPNCPFVRGEYTHNVPIAVTNATACAVPSPNVAIVSAGNTGDLIATGTIEGKVNVWKFDCGLKLVKFIHLSPYDSIFSGILATDSNKVWSTSLEKDTSTYGVELTAMSFIGMTSRQEAYPQTQASEVTEKETSSCKSKPSLICAVTITRSTAPPDLPIKEDSRKEGRSTAPPDLPIKEDSRKEGRISSGEADQLKPSLICAVTITRSTAPPDLPIKEDSRKEGRSTAPPDLPIKEDSRKEGRISSGEADQLKPSLICAVTITRSTAPPDLPIKEDSREEGRIYSGKADHLKPSLICAVTITRSTAPPDLPIKEDSRKEGRIYSGEATQLKPSLICAVTITRSTAPPDLPIKEDSRKEAFESNKAKESVQAMNDENEAKSNLAASNKMLFLLTYDIHSSLAGSITTVVHTSNSSGNSKPGGSKKVCTVARTDDANIYDEIYFQYSDEDTELPQCTNSLIDEQISNVINLNASSSKEDCKTWEPKKIIFAKHFKVLPPPPSSGLLPDLPESGQGSMLDFVGQISQLKSWKSGNLESVGTKLADQTDAVLQSADPITHYLNMNGPLEISDLKWYEGGDGTEKVKVTTFGGSKIGTTTAVSNSNNDGFDSDPLQEEVVSQGVAVQCLSLPAKLKLRDDSRVTHLIPTEDKEHLLCVVSTIRPDRFKIEDDIEPDGDIKMDVDEVIDTTEKSDAKAYFILFKINSKTSVFTLEDNPVAIQELPYNQSPVDLCLLPIDKQEQYSFASVSVDGAMRLYSLPDFKLLSEKRVPKGQFTSVVYCASVERLSVSTKHGMIYFYALNNGEKDSTGDIEDDEFANIDFDMLQRAPREDVCSPTPVIIANKPELDLNDLETLMTLTGSSGTNTTVPYSAVVPGFWCELSPAQRSRSDHQNNRTWRLQNTSSTWDEHVLELTLPYSVSLAHIEFGFTLHTACTANLPIIQVTLLKQNLHGIGYKKDASFGHRSDSPTHYPWYIDQDLNCIENPVNSEEYLQAHNAEILAGPLSLSSGLDLTQQSGSLILTSPRLYRARGRTFLIHIKTLFEPAKDMSKGSTKSESGSKKSGFIGCDWLHQISLTVRSCPHTDVPMERQQRIAMLESNSFLNNLCEIIVGKGDAESRKLALDLLMWVISIRLQRTRLAKSEKGKEKDAMNPVEAQQLECVKIVEKHVDALIKNCILCANRSMAKKCIKIILTTSQGVRSLPKPWNSTFEQTLINSVTACIPYLGACESPGALRWLVALAQHAVGRSAASELVSKCLSLLEKTAKCLVERTDVYHHVLRARYVHFLADCFHFYITCIPSSWRLRIPWCLTLAGSPGSTCSRQECRVRTCVQVLVTTGEDCQVSGGEDGCVSSCFEGQVCAKICWVKITIWSFRIPWCLTLAGSVGSACSRQKRRVRTGVQVLVTAGEDCQVSGGENGCLPSRFEGQSPGALRWLVALAQHAVGRSAASELVSKCLSLLEKTAKCLVERTDVYHHVLRARYVQFESVKISGACESPGALRWLVALAQHAVGRSAASELVSKCLSLLEKTAKCLVERTDMYHHVLRARYVQFESVKISGACESPGALRWLVALAQHAVGRSAASKLVSKCLSLLEKTAKCLVERTDVYHHVLSARYVHFLADCLHFYISLVYLRLGACESPRALRWLVALAQHAVGRSAASELVSKCLSLLEKTAKCLVERTDVYHHVLRVRSAASELVSKCLSLLEKTAKCLVERTDVYHHVLRARYVQFESVKISGACESPGALRWLVALAQHAVGRSAASELVCKCFSLLEKTAKCLVERTDVYHHVLRARFGLYGLPLERQIFAAEVPELGRGSSTPVTYASVLAGDTSTPPQAKPEYQLKHLLNLPAEVTSSSGKSGNPTTPSSFMLLPLERQIFAAEVPELGRGSSTPVTYASVLAGDTSTPPQAKPEYQLKHLLNLPAEVTSSSGKSDSKSSKSSGGAWWAANNGVSIFGAGLSEAVPLHVSCHVASDGTKLECAGGGARARVCAVSDVGGDPHQLWSVVKEGQTKLTSQDPDSLEDVESSLMECDPQDKMDFNEDRFFKEQEQCGIPWAALVTRPPQHTLVVERMHSGARRYIVLDFGHTVRLTDVCGIPWAALVTRPPQHTLVVERMHSGARRYIVLDFGHTVRLTDVNSGNPWAGLVTRPPQHTLVVERMHSGARRYIVLDFGHTVRLTDVCGIPWAGLVTRPPQHTLVVERMHSGARRYIVLDFGHTVRLTDVIIPSCSDLVTLCIDIWVQGEETDCTKLAFATDIAHKHLVLTDIQPAPLWYIKVTGTALPVYEGKNEVTIRTSSPHIWVQGEETDCTKLAFATDIAHKHLVLTDIQPAPLCRYMKVRVLQSDSSPHIWVQEEETDCTKLAFATDIAHKHLVLTDIQPAPLCRYMKITTIGRYGMSAMKCKIPLGWFYGEIADIANPQASITALTALHQDLACRFRLATGKLMDLLNPYLDLYNGNAAHMMAYLNMAADAEPKLLTAYQECIELQQQLHTATNILKKLQGASDCNEQVLEAINKGTVTPEALLERASTDKLRVISENIIDMLLYYFFELGDGMVMQYGEVSLSWCQTVSPLLWEWGGGPAAGLAALLARLCGGAPWWGTHLADTLAQAFSAQGAPVLPIDRCLVLVMYMCRKSLFSHSHPDSGVAAALSQRALTLLQQPQQQPALTAAVLTTLAAGLDAAHHLTNTHTRWDWVVGGRPGSGGASTSDSGRSLSPRAGGADCKLHRRKLHKKLLHQMQELEAARRGIQVALEEQQVSASARFSLKARMAMAGSGSTRSDDAPTSECLRAPPVLSPSLCAALAQALVQHMLAMDSCSGGDHLLLAAKPGSGLTRSDDAPTSECLRAPPVLSPSLCAALAQALVQHMLAMDSCSGGDHLLLAAKVVGRLCALSGGAALLEPSCVLGLARLCVTLPPWPRHALTTLLQDLVEYESASPASPPSDDEGEASWRDPNWVEDYEKVVDGVVVTFTMGGKAPRATRASATSTGFLGGSSGSGGWLDKSAKVKSTKLKGGKKPGKTTNWGVGDPNSAEDVSDDSESEAQYVLNALTKQPAVHSVARSGNVQRQATSSNISSCVDARLESGPAAAGEAMARRVLLAGGGALAAALRAPPPLPAPIPPPRPPATLAPVPPTRPSSTTATVPPTSTSSTAPPRTPAKHQPPLTHTLYDVFRHLALEFHHQMDCTFMENVVSLWLTLNGSAWGSGGAWSLTALAVPADTPRIRLASDTVTAILHQLTTLENISLRCWVLCMQALAWIASLPLQTEGSNQTMGRVILECEHFVPAVVKFISMNVNTDGAVSTSEPYLVRYLIFLVIFV
ncbi:inhibitor of apoptosis domain-containing protein [Phthorimaea operculella]|nr:inhibitor of apoptosis domain-containing protein [Phthorimaea operculella]